MVVTDTAITLQRNFRRNVIPWSNIRSFEVGKLRSFGQGQLCMAWGDRRRVLTVQPPGRLTGASHDGGGRQALT
jgi:hypothetical protein